MNNTEAHLTAAGVFLLFAAALYAATYWSTTVVVVSILAFLAAAVYLMIYSIIRGWTDN